ncbi:hypothetical protein AB2B41_08660 [Marimonas sp. MJW-29]|uniref:Secreted protein n=1 Tax=Sulfitobacter sediminis TaxID=3234186 RepID=A0ABV3RL26_9RHOB
MFAIGFLSLLSVGFVAMAFDGDDDPVGLEQNEDTQDDLNPPQHQGDDLLSFFDPGTIPLEDPDAEEIQRINAFIAELEANPSDDMSERFEAFIAQLEAERAAEAEEQAAAEEIIEDEETTPEEEVAEEAP